MIDLLRSPARNFRYAVRYTARHVTWHFASMMPGRQKSPVRPGTAALLLTAVHLAVVLITAGPATPATPAASYDRRFVEGLEGYQSSSAECGTYIIYFSEKGERLAAEVEKMVCRSADEIAAGIGLEEVSPVAIIIAPDTPSFTRLHSGRLPEWGEAFGDSRRMIIGIDASRVLLSGRPLESVVRHELSHVLLAQRTAGALSPTWFVEGIAMRQSREWTLRDQWHLALTVWREDMPRLGELKGRFPKSAEKAALAYRISYAAVNELLADEERDLITFTAFLRDTGDFEKAFTLTFGETVEEFSGRFSATMRSRYRKISLILNMSPYGLTLTLLFLLAYLIKRSRSRKRVEQWERENAEPPMPR